MIRYVKLTGWWNHLLGTWNQESHDGMNFHWIQNLHEVLHKKDRLDKRLYHGISNEIFCLFTFLSSTELTEILSSLWYNICTKFHYNTSSSLSTDGDIKEYFWVSPVSIREDRDKAMGRLNKRWKDIRYHYYSIQWEYKHNHEKRSTHWQKENNPFLSIRAMTSNATYILVANMNVLIQSN